MTRKDYIQLAHEFAVGLANTYDKLIAVGYNKAIATTCAALKRDNPRFDVERFLAAIDDEVDDIRSQRAARTRELQRELQGEQ